ncbi:MAG: hypothetical protein Q8Q09_20815 [Deltaproteobacteria bacterium]|nr:hypothetical protein [Deltaproteobacteria bacterium]
MTPASSTRRSRKGATLLQLCLGISVGMVLIGAIVPALQRRARAGRTAEAVDRLALLYQHTQTYWAGQQVGPVAPARSTLHNLPASTPLTPAIVPAGHAVTDPPETWTSPTWNALEFRFEDSHYYAYQFDSQGERTTAAFTARACGDLDGNGIASTFERAGRANGRLELESPDGLWISHAME